MDVICGIKIIDRMTGSSGFKAMEFHFIDNPAILSEFLTQILIRGLPASFRLVRIGRLNGLLETN